MDISVVIITWNSQEYIDLCMNSLFKSLYASDYSFEVFVVDNGSTDDTKNKLNFFKNEHADTMSMFFLKQNMGTTYSRNIAIQKIKGNYVIILDSDVYINSAAVHELVSLLKKDKSIGIAVPKLLYPDGRIQKSTDVFPTIFSKAKRFFFLKQIEKKMHPAENDLKPAYVDYAISAFWAVRTELFEKIGLFDENIFYAPEDVDFCLRTWQAGYKIIYDPHVHCIHHTQEISRGFTFNRSKIEHIKGLMYYFRKHHYLFNAPKHREKMLSTIF
jgi:GT2 family glycosyltransferase